MRRRSVVWSVVRTALLIVAAVLVSRTAPPVAAEANCFWACDIRYDTEFNCMSAACVSTDQNHKGGQGCQVSGCACVWDGRACQQEFD
jgi:hypothetical protein